MRCLEKLEEPAVLRASAEKWKAEHLEEPDNATKKYRYRHRDIKDTLVKETGWKCVYCESKIGHTTPGDIEHKVPTSKRPERRFVWENLTVACTECNRRKNDYYDEDCAFLDPYEDLVEDLLIHHGPVVSAVAGNVRAEVTVRTLDLTGRNRMQLILRKIEKIESINNLLARWSQESNDTLRRVLEMEVMAHTEKSSEYSGMVIAILKGNGSFEI